jgi:hypothetical protein
MGPLEIKFKLWDKETVHYSDLLVSREFIEDVAGCWQDHVLEAVKRALQELIGSPAVEELK